MFEDLDFLNFVLLFVVLVGGSFLYSWYAKKRRREQMAALAQQWMFTFSERDDALQSSLEHSYLMSRGRSKQVRNVLQGQERSVDVTVFDYLHTTGNGRSSREHTESVVLLRSSRLDLPFMTIRPKGHFEFFRKRFGKEAIAFADDPAFEENYLVFSAENTPPELVVAALNMNLRAYLARESGLTIEGELDRMLVYRERKKEPTDNLRTLTYAALDIFDYLASADNWS